MRSGGRECGQDAQQRGLPLEAAARTQRSTLSLSLGWGFRVVSMVMGVSGSGREG